MIRRTIAPFIKKLASQYPVVTLMGPRQSGKTTLCKALFPKHQYITLEDLDIRAFSREDPRGFFEKAIRDNDGVILDEVQRVPGLLSYLQGLVDADPKPGRFILTGSTNFQLMESVTQTLAGRTALATLLPFSQSEIYRSKKPSVEKLLWTGFYPRVHEKKLDPSQAMAFYVSTYLERDVRQLIHVRESSQFETFLKLCASRTAQVLNLSNLASDCGVKHNTIKNWISVLEASYVIQLVKPHFRNFRKRLIKAPKLYFIDVGLASCLLEIQNEIQMRAHPLRGALFETFVVSEILKHRLNQVKRTNLYYFRDSAGNEVDLLLDYGQRVIPIEIKMGKTVGEDFFKGLNHYLHLQNLPSSNRLACVIYGGEESYIRSGIQISSFRDTAKTIMNFEREMNKIYHEIL